jgi:hypothetical protein
MGGWRDVDVTVWAVVTWLKTSTMLAAAVAAAWWLCGRGSGEFILVCLATAAAELYLSRQVIREWCSEARMSWWWTP